MKKIPDILTLDSELKSIHVDYKGTVIAAELVDKGISADNIFFKNVSTFRRFISKDVSQITTENDEANYSAQITFELNREGLYDMLPEGITHKVVLDGKEKEPAEIFSLRRQEEREARNFFSPFENEFIHRYLQLEVIEREISNNKNEYQNRAVYEYFFGDSKKLTNENVLLLLHILPLSEKIRNNTELISTILSKIFAKEIFVKRELNTEKLQINEHIHNMLGIARLGMNSILNNATEIVTHKYQVDINNISTKEFRSYLPDGAERNVLDVMLRYFLPTCAPVDVILHPSPSEKKLHLSNDHNSGFLKFNSYI